MPDTALDLYNHRISDLRVRVDREMHPMIDKINKGAEVNLPEIEQALSKVYQEWDQDARVYVRDKIKPQVDQLHAAASRYEELIRAATKTKATTEMTRGTGQSQEATTEHLTAKKGVELQGEFGLNISNKLRSIAAPAVSAVGAGLLLFNVVGATILWPLAPIFAVAAAGAMGIGMYGSITGGNQSRLANELEKAVRRQTMAYENELQRNFRSEWKDFSDNVRYSISVSKRQLTQLLTQQSTAQDSKLSAKHNVLTRHVTKISELRHDLRWLENHEDGGKFVADTEA